MIDSLKTVAAGTGGVVVTWMDWLPIAARVAVAGATVIYILIKAFKEYKR